MRSLEESLSRLAEPLLAEKGLELVDLELRRRGKRTWIRFFIDRVDQAAGGVSVDECGEFNTALSQVLEVEGLIARSCLLEVSSPGLNRRVRKLKDFLRFLGERITVALREPREGRKILKGKLIAADEEGITIEAGKESVKIAHASIKRANLEYRPEHGAALPVKRIRSRID